ncbi:hypothetical protein Mmc1_0389 [Magnetococcus marinus MC-1]|uniref:Uncharacterized protein n=1 Tax=Magnetococcus marinus (strain ATCC BAA-1437 / JCM 17883 / MC-1) TaxID=156889 RepID=A0L4M2_MAGMM|nr:hypothetical protein [Magnetococcus marinus]ABK42915.1 hypothetical protein Mmc1_0389 [Magnetococcus marinus MC-1]
MQPIHRYGLALSLTVIGVLGAVFLYNALWDPLWYFAGNQFRPVNYTFDERLSKTNQFLRHPDSYDCFIFGSSRTTLLNPQQIKGYRCFNFAFSSGRIEEIVAYARYVKKWNPNPKLIIVGVDLYNLAKWEDALSIPAFVQRMEKPPSALRSYLSWGAVALSRQLQRGQSPLPRYYDGQFICRVEDGLPPYQPALDRPSDRLKLPLGGHNLHHYAALAEIFPHSQRLGYIPPESTRHVAFWLEHYRLETIINLYQQVKTHFTRFYDFALPSQITANPAYTYDGSHYDLSVTQRIAHRLSGHVDEFGLEVTHDSTANWVTHYQSAINR